jgi:hypothetical protein
MLALYEIVKLNNLLQAEPGIRKRTKENNEY